MSESISPKARRDGLVTSKVGDETVVYDTETNKASCLNRLTTVVWEACDGNTDISSLLDTVRGAGYQDATEQVVLMAIDQLEQAGLLEDYSQTDNKKREFLSRREMLRLLGIRSATVLPIITTINLQPAIAQISNCIPHCSPCNPFSDVCCGGTQCLHHGSHGWRCYYPPANTAQCHTRD